MGIMIRNKARLVTQGHTQEEGIDYDEVFAPVARIEAIRLFLAYASFKEFVVYQMDVKSAFLYGKIEEEVYLCQPLGFEDPNFPDRVYKVKKALYKLHQAPKAWYETLSTYLFDNGFQKRKIDKTLFIKRHKVDIILVQVYVDDIIFGSTRKELFNAFERLMHAIFQMSCMGELTFFLGLQVKQKNDGIFISQDKYVTKILKKFRFTEVKNVCTPMETQKHLLKDEDGKEVDVHMYRYQVNPKISHLYAEKRIFSNHYMEPTEFEIKEMVSADGEVNAASITTTVSATATITTEEITLAQSLTEIKTLKPKAKGIDGKEIIITESSVRRDLRLAGEEGVDCLLNSTIFETLELMGCQDTIGDTIAQTRFENVSKLSNDSRLVKFNKLPSDEDRMKLNELMELCTNLQSKRKINDIDADKDITLVNDQDDDEMFDVNDLHGEDVFVEKEVADKMVSAAGEVNAASIATTNVEGKKLKDLKNKSFNFIQKMFDRAFKRVNTFVDFRTELVESSLKRAGEELIQERMKLKDLKNKSFDTIKKMFDRAFNRVNTFVDFRKGLVEEVAIDAITLAVKSLGIVDWKIHKEGKKSYYQIIRADGSSNIEKKKVLCSKKSRRKKEQITNTSSRKKDNVYLPQEYGRNEAQGKLKHLMKIILDEEEVAIDAITLAVKSLGIVDWKIHKEGKKSYYQIIRADGSSNMYLVFNRMLKEFDIEDLEDLYNLVKVKYRSTRPMEDLDLLSWGDLKTMFEPHVEDQVWKKQHGYEVLEWKLYDSYGVQSLRMQSVHIYMLVEKRYPLTAPTLIDMLNKKLQIDNQSEMAY
nr:putative ribonuclease H-like domain-containing protein [Tanacetum cinerariifolium]